MNHSRTKPKVRRSALLLLSITMLLLTLYASYIIIINQKLGAKAYTYANHDKALYSRMRFSDQKVIVLKGLHNCIVLTSDSVRLDLFNADAKNVEAMEVGDTVKINVNKPTTAVSFLYLPSDSRLVADSSSVELRGSFDFKRPPNYRITLHNSSLAASGNNSHTNFNKLSVIDVGNSHLKIAKYVHINQLELTNVGDASIAQGWQIGNINTLFNDGREMEMKKFRDSVAIYSNISLQ